MHSILSNLTVKSPLTDPEQFSRLPSISTDLPQGRPDGLLLHVLDSHTQPEDDESRLFYD